MNNFKWIVIFGLLIILTVPVMAEKPTEPTGDIPDTGELYGDLYVILRDVNGVPILNDETGCIQPISGDLNEDGVLDPTVSDFVLFATNGDPYVITAYEGEPFTLASYTTTEGDLVECELSEDMATWAQGVDFGRLNLGRSPDAVINHAFDEAIKNMNNATGIDIDPAGRLVLTFDDGTEKTIDSPAENLALYIKMMKDGHWITTNTDAPVRGNRPVGKGPPAGDGPSTEPRPVLGCVVVEEEDDQGNTVYTVDCEPDPPLAIIAPLKALYPDLVNEERTTPLTPEELQLAASLMAAAADKTGNITLDKLVYINSIYGINEITEDGMAYFDFSGFWYDRFADGLYASRSSGEDCDSGWIWVLQPDLDQNGDEILNHFETQCMEILGYEANHDPSVNAVRFTDMVEAYTTTVPPVTYDFTNNVRAFTQAADDALQVIEYIHNYKVPEVLYPAE